MRQLMSLWGVFVFGLISTGLSNDFGKYLNQTEVLFGSGYEVSDIASPHMVPITLIPGAVAKGAVCLDGSPPAYHWDHGFGSGANNWLVNLEGGGWCNHRKACTFHKTNQRGSSHHMEKQISFGGILSNKHKENPDFFNWNRVKIKYCDGASFAGDSEDKVAQLQFRGQRIFQAAMEELMSKGLRQAKQALLSGCSAGGLATILHCDQFRTLFPSNTRVKCFADAGLFLDAVNVAGGRTLRKFFGGVVSLQGVKSNLPCTCTDHLDATSCFFPENVLGNITAPLFLLNAAYDSWQVVTSLMPQSADPKGIWQDCKNNYAKCSASQVEFLQGFRNHMLNAVRGWSVSKENGLFINSCFAHCQSERQDTWFAKDSPVIGNKGIAVAVGDWFFDRAGSKAIGCPYPCDKTCHNLVFKKSAESFSI